MNRQNIIGVHFDNFSMQETLEEIGTIIAHRKRVQHVVINTTKIVAARKDEKLKSIINECELINVDGQAVVWAARFLGIPCKERVAGIDLMENLLKLSESRGWSVYFLGAKQEVLDNMLEKFRVTYPNLKIAGSQNGYFTTEQDNEIADKIKESKPDIIFVGISSPKKEEFLKKYSKYMDVPFSMGVGGSFDVFAGITERAPLILQKTGLEWLYRIYQEPRRMWKRYATSIPRFVYFVLKEKFKPTNI